MNVLGIETSCDETAVAVVTGEKDIRAHLVLSQIREHAAFGGVVPEIAARAHLDSLDQMIAGALSDSGLGFSDLDAVAATSGPGLIGGVIVGMMAGKAICAAWDIPFLAINHLEAHALTPRLCADIPFPYLVLLVSGGHSQILLAEGVGRYQLWGTTLDDAAGECLDKSAKMMGLPFPGGPALERAAQACTDPQDALTRFPLPRPMQGRLCCDFSFSGLKTAVRAHVADLPQGDIPLESVAPLAFSLQTALCDVLADRCARAIVRFQETYPAHPARARPAFVVSGGVAANRAVRETLQGLTETHGMAFHAPPVPLCSDNAAMVAWAGVERLRAGLVDGLDFAPRPRWPLDATMKG